MPGLQNVSSAPTAPPLAKASGPLAQHLRQEIQTLAGPSRIANHYEPIVVGDRASIQTEMLSTERSKGPSVDLESDPNASFDTPEENYAEHAVDPVDIVAKERQRLQRIIMNNVQNHAALPEQRRRDWGNLVALSEERPEGDLARHPPPRSRRLRLGQTAEDVRNGVQRPLQFRYPPEHPLDATDPEWLGKMTDEVVDERKELVMRTRATYRKFQAFVTEVALLEAEVENQVEQIISIRDLLLDVAGPHVLNAVINAASAQLGRRPPGQGDQVHDDEETDRSARENAPTYHSAQTRVPNSEQRIPPRPTLKRPRQDNDVQNIPAKRPRHIPFPSVGPASPIGGQNMLGLYNDSLADSLHGLPSASARGNCSREDRSRAMHSREPPPLFTSLQRSQKIAGEVPDKTRHVSRIGNPPLELHRYVDPEAVSPPYIPRAPSPDTYDQAQQGSSQAVNAEASPPYIPRTPEFNGDTSSLPGSSPLKIPSYSPPYCRLTPEHERVYVRLTPEYDVDEDNAEEDNAHQASLPVTPEAQIISVDYSDVNLSVRSHRRLQMSSPATRSPPRLRRKSAGITMVTSLQQAQEVACKVEDETHYQHLNDNVAFPPYIPRAPSPDPVDVASLLPRASHVEAQQGSLQAVNTEASPPYIPRTPEFNGDTSSVRSPSPKMPSYLPPYHPLTPEHERVYVRLMPEYDVDEDNAEENNAHQASLLVTPEAQIIPVDYSDAQEMEPKSALRSCRRPPMSSPRSPPRLKRKSVGIEI